MRERGEGWELTIPVYNEEEHLERCVARALDFFDREGLSALRLVLADNGSTDRTAEIGRLLAGKYDRVGLVGVTRKGVGLALKTAWSASGAEWVGYMDLDLATDLAHVQEALGIAARESPDLIAGSRWLPGSAVSGRSPLRTAASWGFNRLLRLALGVGFSDGMCGFKFIRKSAFSRLMRNGAFTDEWFFATELLIKAEWAGMRIRELPVRWTDDPSSKVRLLETVSQYLGDIRRMRAERGA